MLQHQLQGWANLKWSFFLSHFSFTRVIYTVRNACGPCETVAALLPQKRMSIRKKMAPTYVLR